MSTIHLEAPLHKADMRQLRCGDSVLLSGVIYTARDAAHARLCAALEKGEALPVDLKGQLVFYAGPTPPPPGKPTGSIGPTTSMRMDAYTPALLDHGMAAMIGKGGRSPAVIDAIKRNGAVYFAAVGGVAAYMAVCITECTVVAYEDLGTESIKRLIVKNLPLTVAVDALGNDFYELGPSLYRESLAK